MYNIHGGEKMEESGHEIIKEVKISKKAYPIVWIGENGYSITRFGRLVKVIDEIDYHYYIAPVCIAEGEIPLRAGEYYIIAGGVPILPGKVEAILEVRRDALPDIVTFLEKFQEERVIAAAGIKNWTHAVWLWLIEPDMEDVEQDTLVVKDYPYVVVLRKENNKWTAEKKLVKDP
jgi:hypothetical protein